MDCFFGINVLFMSFESVFPDSIPLFIFHLYFGVNCVFEKRLDFNLPEKYN